MGSNLSSQEIVDLWAIAHKHVDACSSDSESLSKRDFESFTAFYMLLLSLCVNTRRAFAAIALASFFGNEANKQVLKDFLFVIDQALAIADKFRKELTGVQFDRAATFCESIRFRHDAVVILIGLGQDDFLSFLKSHMTEHLISRLSETQSPFETIDRELLAKLNSLNLDHFDRQEVGHATVAALLVWACELSHEAGPYNDALAQHAAIGLETLDAALNAATTAVPDVRNEIENLRDQLVSPLLHCHGGVARLRTDSAQAKSLMKQWPLKVIGSASLLLGILGSDVTTIDRPVSDKIEGQSIAQNESEQRVSNLVAQNVNDPRNRQNDSRLPHGTVFIPSRELIDRILDAQVEPIEGLFDENGVAEEITSDVEGVLQSLAIAASDASQEPICEFRLTDSEGFLIEPACRELIALWDLKVSRQLDVLNGLVIELRELAENQAQRKWGTLLVKSDGLLLRVHKNRV